MEHSSLRRVIDALVVAAVAGATIGVQLIQTRVMSAIYYNHVVYVTITIALLGFGISGVAVSLLLDRIKRIEILLGWLIAGYAVSIVICVGLASHLPEVLPHADVLSKLLLSYALLVVPFVFAGAVLGLIFMKRGRDANTLYFVDLSSSAIAVIAFVVALGPLGASGYLWLCAAAVGVAALAQGVRAGSTKELALFVLCGLVLPAIVFGADFVGRQPEAYKTLGRVYADDWDTETIEVTRWSPISRIDVWSDSFRDQVFGSRSMDPESTKMLTQDADAFAIMWGPQIVSSVFDAAEDGTLTSALSLTYSLTRSNDDALVIGVGGGIDIVTARAYGAKRITGVEINPATTSLLKGQYADFLQWPRWSGVNLVRAEGRHFVRSNEGRFDSIVMSGVDTFSALNSGAYVLSENYLYTTEAIGDYLDALKPGGVVAIYRWLFRQPRESLRLASIFLEMADARGLDNPAAHFMVVAEDLGWSSYAWAATFFRNEPFTSEEVNRVLGMIAAEPRLTLVYVPKVAEGQEQEALERAAFKDDPSTSAARDAYRALFEARTRADRQRFYDEYVFRVDPVFDDRPFFFEYYKPASSALVSVASLEKIRGPIAYYLLYVLLAIAVICSLAGMIAPLYLFKRDALRFPGAGRLLAVFASLGLGFMFFEVGAMQLLTLYIGDPMLSLAIVLAGLLFFAGVGSLVSGKVGWGSAIQRAGVAMTCAAILIAAWVAVMSVVVDATMTYPWIARVGIVLASLAPVGLVLGSPFAAGIVHLSAGNGPAIPWVWGVNGLTSVAASVLAIVVAMKVGFIVVVALSSIIYAAGALAVWAYTRVPQQSHVRAVA